MRTYVVSETYYFRELGAKVQAGQSVVLRPGDAERYMASHPGLLKPAMVTTQAEVPAVRKAEEPAETPAPAAKPAETTPAVETPAPAPSVEAPAEAPKAKRGRKPKAADPA